jgi:hypothetical protein
MDDVKPANKKQQELIDIWKKWHLNGTHAGTEKQEEILEQNKDVYPYYKKKDHYDWACRILKESGLYEDEGFRYGSGWTHRELPEFFEEYMDDLLDDIDNLEEERKGDPLTVPNEKGDTEEVCNAFWEMIEEKTGFTGRDAELCAAFIEMFGLCENDLEDIKINETSCEVQGTYYLAGTDAEMDSAWDDELENYLDECVLPDLPETARNYFDKESWKRDARYDGRGHALNHYDGGEEECQINGTWYYAYKN